ncbi:hypothetical protein SUGI_0852810 [Cryptomeria japonica]|nr:hypothetical protein SUGI_0852810 [Cryptomeria japonica]
MGKATFNYPLGRGGPAYLSLLRERLAELQLREQGGLGERLGGWAVKVAALARSLFGIVQMYLPGFDPRALAPLLNLFKISKPLKKQIWRMCLAQRAKMEIVD